MLDYKGYMAEVRLDLRDGVLYGRVVGTKDIITFHSERADQLQHEFEQSVDAYLDACAQWGDAPEKPAAGKFLIRTTADRHSLISRAAQEAGKSVNEWAEEALTSAAQRLLASTPEHSRVPIEIRSPGPTA